MTIYLYDGSPGAGGRLTAKFLYTDLDAFDEGEGTPEETVTYLYDAFGRVLQVNDSALGVTTNVFDDQGRLTSVASPEGTIHYEYDDATSRLTRTYTGVSDTNHDSDEDDGKAVTDTRYEYDSFGRLEKVIVVERNDTPLTTPEETSYRYDKVGNLDRVDQANGVIVDYVYDDLNRLDLLTHYASDLDNEYLADNDILARFDYTVATNGQRIGVIETNANEATTTIDWFYDEIGRLTKEVYDSFDNDLDFTAEYDLDLVGNRTEKRVDKGNNSSIDEIIKYDYDANDRLLKEEFDDTAVGTTGSIEKTTVYEYGPDDEHTTQTKKTVWQGEEGTGTKQSETTYTFDLRGRLIKIEIDDNGDSTVDKTIDYVYNDDGIRVEQVKTDHVAVTTETTTYLVDANNHTGFSQVIEERLDGILIKSFVLGHDVIAQAGPAATPVYFLLYDGHGSTRALTDESGALVSGQVYAYDSYGNPLTNMPSDPFTTLLYSGEQFDMQTGLQYLRARYYEPSTGRFGSLDAYAGNNQDPLSLHKYTYARMNPIMYADPSGEVYWAVFAAVGAIGGVALNAAYNYSTGQDLSHNWGYAAVGGAAFGLGFAFPALGPTFLAQNIVASGLIRAYSGFLIAQIANAIAYDYIPPLAREIQIISNLLTPRYPHIAAKVNMLAVRLTELRLGLAVDNAYRPLTAQLGLLFNVATGASNAVHTYVAILDSLTVVASEVPALSKLLPPNVLEKFENRSVAFEPSLSSMVWAGLQFKLDPAGTVRHVRYAIESLENKNYARFVSEMDAFLYDLRNYGSLHVR